MKVHAQSLGRQSDFRNSSKAVAVQFCTLSIHLLDVISQRLKRSVRGLTWGEVLIDGPVVHLKRSIAPISGEAHYMVLAVITAWLLLSSNSDVRRSDVECDSNFALFLKRMRKVQFCPHRYINKTYMGWIQVNFVTFLPFRFTLCIFLYSPSMKRCIYSVLINF